MVCFCKAEWRSCKEINFIDSNSYNITLNITNNAWHQDVVAVGEYINYLFEDYDYSYGPNATFYINNGSYIGNITSFNKTLNAGEAYSITYKVNGTYDYSISNLYMCSV